MMRLTSAIELLTSTYLLLSCSQWTFQSGSRASCNRMLALTRRPRWRQVLNHQPWELFTLLQPRQLIPARSSLDRRVENTDSIQKERRFIWALKQSTKWNTGCQVLKQRWLALRTPRKFKTSPNQRIHQQANPQTGNAIWRQNGDGECVREDDPHTSHPLFQTIDREPPPSSTREWRTHWCSDQSATPRHIEKMTTTLICCATYMFVLNVILR